MPAGRAGGRRPARRAPPGAGADPSAAAAGGAHRAAGPTGRQRGRRRPAAAAHAGAWRRAARTEARRPRSGRPRRRESGAAGTPGPAGTALRLPAPFHLTSGPHNPIASWLDELGLFGLRGHRKFVPAPVFALPDEQLALFLRRLWATDGAVGWDERARRGEIGFASTSRRLVDDVSRLLLRFGVLGRIERTRKAVSRDRWHLRITESEHQRAFIRSVGVPAARGGRPAARPASCRRSPTTPRWTPSPTRCGAGSSRCWPRAG